MKLTMMNAALFASTLAFAGTVELPRTAKPQFADLEAATNLAVAAFAEAKKRVTMTIECDAAKDNAMRVFVGKDANKDGKLGLEEVGVRFGWDAGQWIVEEPAGQNNLEVAPKTTANRKTCLLTWNLDANGKCELGSLKEGDTVLGGLTRLAFDKGWNCVRIVRNGKTDPKEKITLEVR